MLKGSDERYLHIEIKGGTASVVIREGSSNFAANSFSCCSDTSITVSGSNLPIKTLGQSQPVDLLISCTESEFKFYFNGQYFKSISTLHNPSDGSFPLIEELKPSVDYGRLTKLSWTYGKLSICFILSIGNGFVNIFSFIRSLCICVNCILYLQFLQME